MVPEDFKVRIKARDKAQYEHFVSVVTALFEDAFIIETAGRRVGYRLIEVFDCDSDLLQLEMRFHAPSLAYVRDANDPRRLLVELIFALNEPAQVPG